MPCGSTTLAIKAAPRSKPKPPTTCRQSERRYQSNRRRASSQWECEHSGLDGDGPSLYREDTMRQPQPTGRSGRSLPEKSGRPLLVVASYQRTQRKDRGTVVRTTTACRAPVEVKPGTMMGGEEMPPNRMGPHGPGLGVMARLRIPPGRHDKAKLFNTVDAESNKTPLLDGRHSSARSGRGKANLCRDIVQPMRDD